MPPPQPQKQFLDFLKGHSEELCLKDVDGNCEHWRNYYKCNPPESPKPTQPKKSKCCNSELKRRAFSEKNCLPMYCLKCDAECDCPEECKIHFKDTWMDHPITESCNFEGCHKFSPSQPDHSIDSDKMVEPSQPEKINGCDRTCLCHNQPGWKEVSTKCCEKCSIQPIQSQLTEEDRELLKNWAATWDKICNKGDFWGTEEFELRYLVHRLLDIKDHEANERVKNLEEKLSVKSFKAAVEDERKRCAKIADSMDLPNDVTTDGKLGEFYSKAFRHACDKIKSEILNPKPKD